MTGIILAAVIGLLVGVAGCFLALRPRLLRDQAELANREQRQLELTADLSDRDERLADTDRRHDAFIGQAADQLTAPLQVLDTELAALPEPETAQREVRRIRRLATDLSTLARVQRGEVDLEVTEVELRALATEIADRLRPQFEAAGGELTLLPGGTATVRADRRQLAQVLINLLGNALQASADQARPQVLIGVSRTSVDGTPVGRITITDNGSGLPAEETEAVFERFHRAPGSRPGPGTGLGLTISRAVIDAQQGRLGLTSPGPGRGATATITLPRPEQPVSE